MSNEDATQYLPVIGKSVSFKFKSVTKHWVQRALKGLKESKSPKKIPAKVLKGAAELICVILILKCNESLWMGAFPELCPERMLPCDVSRLVEEVVHDP